MKKSNTQFIFQKFFYVIFYLVQDFVEAGFEKFVVMSKDFRPNVGRNEKNAMTRNDGGTSGIGFICQKVFRAYGFFQCLVHPK